MSRKKRNLMRYIALSLLLPLLLGLSACVPSLHELYAEKDLVFEPALLGDWVEDKADSKSLLTFAKGEGKEYKLTSIEGKDKSTFIAHVVKLGDRLFLDLASDPSVDCPTLSVPVHMFVLVSQTSPKLQMRGFDEGWLKRYVEKNPRALKHEIVDNDVVLTASTKQLQRFLLSHVNTKDAFKEPVQYVRKG
jgi:hypothetical protein